MYRFTIALIKVILLAVLINGCSSGGFAPVTPPEDLQESGCSASSDNTHLWGYWNIEFDPVTCEMVPVANRTGMFTVNVVNFLNMQPASLGFDIHDVIPGPDYLDIHLTISITHPFPGFPKYNGYDVRGVFMGDGSEPLQYGFNVVAPMNDVDQFMPDESVQSVCGGPDGYTRWFNMPECTGGGMPLFNYTPGKLAPAGYAGTSTICPYRYFADGLGDDENVFEWLTDSMNDTDGVFSSGATNSREYYLRFPDDKMMKYGYAVIANWEGPDPDDHPTHAIEAVSSSIEISSHPFYVDDTDNGGTLGLDIGVYSWGAGPGPGGVMSKYHMYVESPIFGTLYDFSIDDMIVESWTDNWCTYAVGIQPDNLTSAGETYAWLIVEYHDEYYTNPYDVPNLAEEETIAAFFRFPVTVLDENPNPENEDPVCDIVVHTPMPAEGFGSVNVEFSAEGSYDPDGDDLTYSWDFDGDGEFGDLFTGNPFHPFHDYAESYDGMAYVLLDDSYGGQSSCGVEVDITVFDSTLFHWVGTSGSGDPMVSENYWQYVPSAEVWDENGNIDSMLTGCINSWIYTPDIELPGTDLDPFDMYLKVVHWGGGNTPWLFEPNPAGFDTGGFIGYRLGETGDWYLNSDTYPWLMHESGQNFNSVNPMNLVVGAPGCWCSVFPDPQDDDIWENRAFGAVQPFGLWGSESTPWTSEFMLDWSLKGETIQIGFYYAGLEEGMGKADYPGWCIKEIEVYVE